MTKRKKHRKAILKSITWRLISSTALFATMWIWSADLKFASGLTAIDAVVKMILYYLHELAWQNKSKYIYRGNHEHKRRTSGKGYRVPTTHKLPNSGVTTESNQDR